MMAFAEIDLTADDYEVGGGSDDRRTKPYVLSVSGLTVEVGHGTERRAVVDDLSFNLERGETLCIAGESGSGKSMTALAIMGLLPKPGARLAGGAIALGRQRVDNLSEVRMREVRGSKIAMIFQEPMTSLNPVLTIGRQLTEAIEAHEPVGRTEARRRAIAALKAVRIPDAASRLSQHPHELSGGMRQRVMIAMALALKPDVLIADEPTTALDVTVQGEVLELLRDMQRELGTAVILITHDMGVVAEMASRVVVMRHGRVVETGTTEAIFERPREAYTKELLAAVPRIGSGTGRVASRTVGTRSGEGGSTEAAATPIVSVTDLAVRFDLRGGFLNRIDSRVHAVEGVSFDIAPGQTLSLVGESGCGKSTTAKALAGLVPYEGDIVVAGTNMAGLPRGEAKAMRRNVQMIFQDPFASLDPRMTIGDLIAEPMLIHGTAPSIERRDRVADLLARVGLSADEMRRYPHEFSGGQRQRICIARALSLRPKLIIADESVSALDVSVQARVLELLARVAGRVRHRLSLHLPRHGRGREHLGPRGRHVSRPDRRDRHPRPDFREPAASLYTAADRGGSGARPEASPPAFPASRHRNRQPGAQARRCAAAPGADEPRRRPLGGGMSGASMMTAPKQQASADDGAILSLSDFSLRFKPGKNLVDGVGFSVKRGETLAIVGESGCGKSVTALALMGLLPMPPAQIVSGRAVFGGQDMFAMPTAERANLRGNRISMIFQEPMTSLNPAFTVGDQIVEGIRRHQTLSKADARALALETLRKVRIPAPETRFGNYPHQLSGGMRQRVMIAMALANSPQLLIADEPTTALDVTIQAQILSLIDELRRETGTAVILITHDLGVVAESADRVAVMYAGHVVETGPVAEVFGDPQHPYTIGLMGAIPSLGPRSAKLATIPGTVPSIERMPAGCRFSPRCPFAQERCRETPPKLAMIDGGDNRDDGHGVACFFAPLESYFAEVA